MQACIFCDILHGRMPGSFVYRDEHAAADGAAAMQEVFHVHLHVFPRFTSDGFGLRFAPECHTRRPSRAALDELATELSHLHASTADAAE